MVLYQPQPGYRVSIDPYLLAGWVLEEGVPDSVLDVGTGSGVLALLLGRAGSVAHGIDRLAEWIPWAQRSALESGLADRVTFGLEDVRTCGRRPVDLVVSNPPYFKPGSGAVPADSMRAHARHALAGDLDELVPSMARLGRRVAMVLPSSRADEASAHLARCGRPVKRRCDLGRRLVLLDGRGSDAALRHEAIPLQQHGDHHPRIRAWYRRLGAHLARPGAPAVDPG